MTDEPRFDIIYDGHGAHITYHFCREREDEDHGCYGTNPRHGFSFEEAKQQMIEYHKEQAERWANMTVEEWRGHPITYATGYAE